MRPAKRVFEPAANVGEDGRLGNDHELRRRALEPREQVTDLDHGKALERRVPARVLGLARDVELVVHVHVRRDAERPERGDRLARDLEVERLVQEELARSRIDHGRALVAHDRLLERRLVEVAPHRPEHAAGRHQHVDARALRASDRGARARAELPSGADERPVEVRGERLDGAAEPIRKEAQPPVDDATNCATSAICCGSSWSLNDGIPPWPSVTRCTASS